MSKLLKTLPKFTNEHEERAFWKQEDSTEYLDWTTAKRVVLPNLKPSTKTIFCDFPSTCLIRSKRLQILVMCRINNSLRYGCRKNFITIELTGGLLMWVSQPFSLS